MPASTVKLPEICPEPPRIGSRITGAEITSLSSTIANGRPTFSCVTCAKRRAPLMLNLKVTIGSLVRWSKPGCASVRSSPVTMIRFSITYAGLPSFGVPVEQFGLRRHAALLRLLGTDRGVDQPEGELRGAAEQVEDARRIVDARHLHEDAVHALPLDQRLDGADLVDAALDDLDRLLDHLPHALGDAPAA